ncbi:RtcB family protein [Candidatus Berkiella cookevillensis]|uniref:3'-phosphate/5'-hydroxy nucleic acid ligase n=1 Tax=Candidatus Berkiella cookevillensis TaxID=437022 RepID=A0A0Q9YNG5_9GAMM|nr:RtcB family protein [Candidatus Berkiella cookevillensis]MCS5707376.1 RtcB family protein [Candidatus Berkiella cookevillensis]
MPIKQQLHHGTVPIKVFTNDIDEGALLQLKQVSQLDIIHAHIAAMPDVHMGIGAAVGSVIPTKSAIIPAAVGVDIGCGMNAIRLSLTAHQLPNNLKSIRQAIESAIPVGFEKHNTETMREKACKAFAHKITHIFNQHPELYKIFNKDKNRWMLQMGTLGGGNHFIELCIDESQQVWLMLHSGSRGIGNAIGTYFIALAQKDMAKHLHHLPHKDLSYFREGTEHFNDYVEAVELAQQYAYANRQEMMQLIIQAIRPHLPPFTLTHEAVNCHHNYVQQEYHFGTMVYLTRKGAISAKEGELGIIPGSMGTQSYIVRGKGNPESFHSCAHGAGRRMSRNAAKQRFTQKDLIHQTQGIECRKDKAVIDEIPSAYKDIDSVMKNQTDLVETLHTLKQVLCIKG